MRFYFSAVILKDKIRLFTDVPFDFKQFLTSILLRIKSYFYVDVRTKFYILWTDMLCISTSKQVLRTPFAGRNKLSDA